MAYEVKIPSVGESVSSAMIAQWHVEDGGQVEAGALLATLDTDKVSTEVTAEVGGVVRHLAKEGEEVSVGAVVARIEEPAGAGGDGGKPDEVEVDSEGGEREEDSEGGVGEGEGEVSAGGGGDDKSGALGGSGDQREIEGEGVEVAGDRREVRVPSVGESVTSATVGKWHVEDGAVVRAGQVLVTLETDKVAQDLEAEHGGRVEVVAAEGVELEVGGLVAYVFEGVGGVESPGGEVEDKKGDDVVVDAKGGAGDQGEKSGPAGGAEVAAVAGAGAGKGAAPEGQVRQAGRGGEDGEERGSGEGRVTRRKMTPLRRKVAEHLVSAQRNAALLTTFNECDMSEVMAMRKAMQEEFVARHGTKLGFMSFFLKAVVDGLKQVPEINARVDGDEVVQNHFYDIGVAVGTERGLVVPVVRDCDQKSFAELEHTIAGYAKKAREGKLAYADLQGGVFTISNGGIYGSLLSTPILSPPQSGILGMHTIQERPVALNGQVVVRPMMYLALTYDHRLVDGKEAVTFLVRVKDCIENPARMMVGA